MRLRLGCEFRFETAVAVPLLMLVRVRPDGPYGIVEEAITTDPKLRPREYVDTFGDHCWRLVAPAGGLTVRYDTLVEVEPTPDPVHPDEPLLPPQELPDDALLFTLPSRQIESDLLLADAWRLFGE